MKHILIIFFSIIAIAGIAQNSLTPGKNSFQKKWVKNDSYEMVWYAMQDSLKVEIGKVITSIIVNKKTITIVTSISMNNSKSGWVDSTIADIKTLKPIHHTSYNPQRDMLLDFGKIVTGYYHDKMKKQNLIIADTTNSAYFDSNLYPFLVGWLPLNLGYKQEISIYDYNPSAKIGAIKAFVNEVKSGFYESKKLGNRKVWVVTTSDEIGNGEKGISTYYFDKINRKLWMQEINAGGHQILMKLKE